MTLRPLPREDPVRTAPSCIDARIVANDHIVDRYWQMRISAPSMAQSARPGQFLMLTPWRVATESLCLPRPMAVYDADASAGTVDIVYGVVGSGTQRLRTFLAGETIPAVGPLGRPFHVEPAMRSLLTLGRGIGICSLTLLACRHAGTALDTTAVLSARTAEAVIGGDLFRRYGVRVLEVSDERGSSQPQTLRARLVALMDEKPPDLIAVCGSRRLTRLAADLGQRWRAPVQISVEAHMACGLGYCHCCTPLDSIAPALPDEQEQPLVCNAGPVFQLEPDVMGASTTSQ